MPNKTLSKIIKENKDILEKEVCRIFDVKSFDSITPKSIKDEHTKLGMLGISYLNMCKSDFYSQSLTQILEHIVEEGYKKLKLGERGNINDDSLSKFDIGFNEGIESIIFTIKSELKKIKEKYDNR